MSVTPLITVPFHLTSPSQSSISNDQCRPFIQLAIHSAVYSKPAPVSFRTIAIFIAFYDAVFSGRQSVGWPDRRLTVNKAGHQVCFSSTSANLLFVFGCFLPVSCRPLGAVVIEWCRPIGLTVWRHTTAGRCPKNRSEFDERPNALATSLVLLLSVPAGRALLCTWLTCLPVLGIWPFRPQHLAQLLCYF